MLDEHIDPEVHFTEASELRASTPTQKTKWEPEPSFIPKEDMELEATERARLRAERKAMLEEDAKHFTYPISYVSEEEIKHQKELKSLRKAEKEKEADIRHHAWE